MQVDCTDHIGASIHGSKPMHRHMRYHAMHVGHLQRHSFNDHSLSLPSRLVLLPSLHPSSGTLFLLTLDLQTVSHVLNADSNQSFLQLVTPPRTVQCHRSALIRVFMRLIALLEIVLVS